MQYDRLNDQEKILELFRQWRQQHEEALLIIDRFEELFTLNSDEVKEKVAVLIGRCALEVNVRVLLVFRDDFLIHCKEHASLSPIFSDLTAMLPLSGAPLRRAIIQPALKCGYRFQHEALIDEMVQSVEKERGAMPLLAFATSRLWEKRDQSKGLLTDEGYREIGRVEGALVKHADTVIERIGAEKLPIVREIFRNLITAENTRAARDTDELMSVFADQVSASEVLTILINARLLTAFEAKHPDGEKPRSRVEIIHESLLTNWPRLVRWQTQDAESAQLRDELRQAAQLWERKARSQDLLWTGTAYLEYQAWRQRYPGGLTATEEAFAKAMIRRVNRRRTRHRIATILLVAALSCIVLVIGSLWRNATTAKDQALSEAKRAEAGKVLMLARAQPNLDPSKLLGHALASLLLSDTKDGRHLVLDALSKGPPAQFIRLPLKYTYFFDFSPNDHWALAGSVNGIQLLPSDGKPLSILEKSEPQTMVGRAGQFSNDGKFAVWKAVENPSITKIWSLEQKKLVHSFHFEGYTSPFVRGGKIFFFTDLTAQYQSSWSWKDIRIRVWNFENNEPQVIGLWENDGITNFEVDPTGQWLCYPRGNRIYLRSMIGSGLGSERLVGVHSSKIAQVQFRPKHNEIAVLDNFGEIRFWSIREATDPVRIISGKQKIQWLWFNPDGSYLAARGDKVVLQYDLTLLDPAEPQLFQYQDENAHQVRFDHHGRWMAVLWESMVAFYPLQTDAYEFKSNLQDDWAFSVRFGENGKSIVTGFSEDGLRRWRMPVGFKGNATKSEWKLNHGVRTMDVDGSGNRVLIGTPEGAAYLISHHTGNAIPLMNCIPVEAIDSISFSPDGNSAAAVALHGVSENLGVQIWNLKTGSCSVLKESLGKASLAIKYSSKGDLFSGDTDGNLYQWNLSDGSYKILAKGKGIISKIAISSDGRYVAAAILSCQRWEDINTATSDLVLHDLKTNQSSYITSHGTRVFSVAFDPFGKKVVTGDIDGVIRVGSITGGDPHLLLGSKGIVGDVIVHPTGEWIASTEQFGPTIRLWRMPEGKPIHTLPYQELLKALQEVTNVRVVQDSRSLDGYRIEYAVFPGWKDVPSIRPIE
jgi:WD40 repeat protein